MKLHHVNHVDMWTISYNTCLIDTLHHIQNVSHILGLKRDVIRRRQKQEEMYRWFISCESAIDCGKTLLPNRMSIVSLFCHYATSTPVFSVLLAPHSSIDSIHTAKPANYYSLINDSAPRRQLCKHDPQLQQQNIAKHPGTEPRIAIVALFYVCFFGSTHQ